MIDELVSECRFVNLQNLRPILGAILLGSVF